MRNKYANIVNIMHINNTAQAGADPLGLSGAEKVLETGDPQKDAERKKGRREARNSEEDWTHSVNPGEKKKRSGGEGVAMGGWLLMSPT